MYTLSSSAASTGMLSPGGILSEMTWHEGGMPVMGSSFFLS